MHNYAIAQYYNARTSLQLDRLKTARKKGMMLRIDADEPE